jgi:two-component system, LytTR family, response regulator
MKTIIIEDEAKNRDILKKIITDYCPDVQIVKECTGIEDSLKEIAKLNPDLVLLDIEIEDGNAFDLLNKIETIPFEIIFITAYESYCIKAFKYNAIDYLLKPINIEELIVAVSKAKEKLGKHIFAAQVKELLHDIKHQNADIAKIAIHSMEGIDFIALEDIILLEANGNYTTFFLKGNRKIVSSKKIREYEELFADRNFFRIHNSYIVNLNCIKKYIKGRGGFVVMENEVKIEVASRKKNEFLAKFE